MMSPLVLVLICKFVALQLAVEIMHGPSLASQTQPTPARNTFTVILKAIRAGVGLVWLERLAWSNLTTSARPINQDEMHLARVYVVPRGQNNVGLCAT